MGGGEGRGGGFVDVLRVICYNGGEGYYVVFLTIVIIVEHQQFKSVGKWFLRLLLQVLRLLSFFLFIWLSLDLLR